MKCSLPDTPLTIFHQLYSPCHAFCWKPILLHTLLHWHSKISHVRDGIRLQMLLCIRFSKDTENWGFSLETMCMFQSRSEKKTPCQHKILRMLPLYLHSHYGKDADNMKR